MRPGHRAITPILAGLLLLAVVGCGKGDDRAATAGTTASTPSDVVVRTVPTVVFTFGPDGLTPAVGRVKLGPGRVVDVEVVAADGRPHGVVAQVGGQRIRIVANPGQTAGRLVRGVKPGRYRVVPDGATEPVVMLVEK